MAVTESWVLDGLDISSGDFQILELVADPPKARPEWIAAADSEFGALTRIPLHENREMTFKLRVTQQASMDTAFDKVGALADKLRKASKTTDGIALVWTPANSTRARTFDVLAGEVTELPIALDGHGRSWFLQRPIFTVVLTAKPYWRDAEVLSSTTTAATPLITHILTATGGDIPALGRLIVTDNATQARRHVQWGLESQYYNAGTSLIVESDSMVTAGFAGAGATRAGAYDPGAAGNSVVRLAVTPSTPVAVCGTGVLTHVGTFRVVGRFYLESPVTQYVRLKWRAGETPYTTNAWAASTAGRIAHWTELDLGTITIPTATLGTQSWDGQIEAFGTLDAAPVGVEVDYLMLVPAAEGYGVARSDYRYQPPPSLLGRDEFTAITAGTVLNARVAPAGGTWATAGDGTATDFTGVDSAGGAEAEQRSVASEPGVLGLYALLGTTSSTNVEVGARVWKDGLGFVGGTIVQGLVARFVDAINLMRFTITWAPADPLPQVRLLKRVAGTVTDIGRVSLPLAFSTWYRLRLIAFSSGRAVGQILDAYDQGVLATIETYDADLATGGALATGKSGFVDHNTSSTTVQRFYDDFYFAAPATEPVVTYSSRSIQVRYDTTIRQDSAGVSYGPPATYRGSRFLVPPGDSRIAVVARRAFPPTMSVDSVTDSTQVQVGIQQRGLVVPR